MLETKENLTNIGYLIWNGDEMCPIYSNRETGDIYVEDVINSLPYYIDELADRPEFMDVSDIPGFEEAIEEARKVSGAVGAIMLETGEALYFYPAGTDKFSYGISVFGQSDTIDKTNLPVAKISGEVDVDDI